MSQLFKTSHKLAGSRSKNQHESRHGIITQNHNRGRIIISLLICLFLCSCIRDMDNNDCVTGPEIQNSWSRFEYFAYFYGRNNILLNSKVADNQLIVTGPSCTYAIQPDQTVSGMAGATSALWSTSVIGDVLFVKAKPSLDELYIYPIQPGFSNDSFLHVKLQSLDENLSGVSIPNSGYIGAINDKNQFLCVVRYGDQFACLLLDFILNYDDTGITSIKLDTFKIIEHPDLTSSQWTVDFYKDTFFVTTYRENFVIGPDGTIELLNFADGQGYIYDFFTGNNSLYCKAGNNIFKSDDSGKSWHKVMEGIASNWSKFMFIKDRLMTFYGDRIFEIDLLAGCCIELDNSGIERKAITSMAELDHTVYATTYTGLYFTETERLKPKSNDAEQ